MEISTGQVVLLAAGVFAVVNFGSALVIWRNKRRAIGGSRADPRRDPAGLGTGWGLAWRRLGHAQVQAQDLQAFVHRQICVGRNAEPRRCRCGNLRRPFVTGRPEHKCKRRQLAHARSIISQFRWASCSPERVVSLNLVISKYEVTRCRTWAGPVPRPGRAWPQLLTSP